MIWIKIENELPPVNEQVLVLWRNINGELVYGVSSRSRITRHCGKDSPIDNRYWIFASRTEVKPIYWRYLPQLPPTE